MDSEQKEERNTTILPYKKEHRWIRNGLIISGSIFVLCFLIIGSSFAYQQVYKNEIYPGIYVGHYHLGGMSPQEAREFIENFNNRISKEGLNFSFINDNNVVDSLKLNVVSVDDSSVELVNINGEKLVDDAMLQGRQGSFFTKLFTPLYHKLFSRKTIFADVSIEQKFKDSLNNSLLNLGDKPHNANLKIISVLPPAKYEIISEKSGNLFDYDLAINSIVQELSQLSLAPIELEKREFMPEVLSADISPIVSKLDSVFSYGDLNLNYVDSQTNDRKDWNIPVTIYADWLEVRKTENGDPVFALSEEKVEAYLETLRPLIDTPAQNARFTVENEKVNEFQASQSGISLNTEKTYNDLNTVFMDRNYRTSELSKTITVTIDLVNPDVEISSINNLGITDVIGIGTSTFRDSHTNRIKNIANAVKRLNGILIKPGEVFSANKFAGPYTAENGFLPEQVIKGDKIKAEIGGGMCQIGTTLFRMAMNSAMPIVERRNHSLVVGYYADPVNGNPGTDATLYEPDVDFKFSNDTGNYLLLQTNIDYKKQMLTFTLWGKSDGRKGWYTHPIVSKWIPAGEPRNTQSTDGSLKPGQTSCQSAFKGAIASFVYTRITSSSEKIERVFDSYYRPLPRICIVGAGVASSTQSGSGTEVPTASSTPNL